MHLFLIRSTLKQEKLKAKAITYLYSCILVTLGPAILYTEVRGQVIEYLHRRREEAIFVVMETANVCWKQTNDSFGNMKTITLKV